MKPTIIQEKLEDLIRDLSYPHELSIKVYEEHKKKFESLTNTEIEEEWDLRFG